MGTYLAQPLVNVLRRGQFRMARILPDAGRLLNRPQQFQAPDIVAGGSNNDLAPFAARVVVASVLLNLDETLMRP